MQLASQVGLDSNDWNAFFVAGEVDFSQSETKLDSCRTYVIHAELKNHPRATIYLNNCDSLVEITRLELNQ
jgi:hypothetical protein